MQLMKVALALAIALAITAGQAAAQTTTGTIRGHVEDAQGLALPGVTVTVTSDNLQGTRATVTSENGDFVLPSLPSGAYALVFELSGFERQTVAVRVAPTQDVPVKATLGIAGLTDSVTVTSRTADVLTNTAQVATNFSAALVSTLPTSRDINAYLLLAPGVHPSGPNGAYSIAGSTTYENLFLVNGVTVNENLRGQANDLYIEDAIQETTVATAGVSAEYGRFSGGVVNVVTKSGGNMFQGSYRQSLINDNWRALTPFEQTAIAADPLHKELRVDKTVPTHEYTMGGPVVKDHLWFFTAGRVQTQKEGRTLVSTNIPYTFERPTRRYEGKGTYSISSSHRFQGDYVKVNDKQVNNTFSTAASMDLNSLENRELPQDLYSVNYSGVLGSRLVVEGLWSRRHYSFVGSGAKSTDLIDGTLMIDNARGFRYWSATFCGVCTPESRDNENVHAKGTYFVPSGGSGSHSMTFGYDNFNDIRLANNHQSGSDYRILGTGTIVRGSGASAVIYPQLLGNGTTVIQWNPIPLDSQGSNFRTHALFYNDSWRVNGRLTANLGVRWDKNHGEDQQGNLVAKDSGISPRLGVVLDPFGDQKWSMTASFAQYTAALSNSIGDSSSAGGNPQTFRYVYRGPDINADVNAANPVSTPAALAQLFAWYNANGGSSLPFERAPVIPGVSPQIRSSLQSPNVVEYASGVNRQFGNRAALRVDYVFRNYRDFYAQRTDATTGQVANALGQKFDLALVENTNDIKRRYSGLTAQSTYRVSARSDAGVTYTLSRAWGNFNGETTGSGPVASDILQYPEYKRASWNYPDGDLQIDQRHRARLWFNYGPRWIDGLTFSLLQTLETGTPFGPNNLNGSSANGVDPRPFVTGTSYLTPPSGSLINYFFTADCATAPKNLDVTCVGGQRDAFRTEGAQRTDFATRYSYRIKTGSRSLDSFVKLDVVNLFNKFQLCGCGGTIFSNGGAVAQTRIDQTIRTSVSNPTLYSTFNPFTATPVQGVNWDYGPNFGKALNRLAWTSPRQVRLSFGVSF